MDTSLDSHVSQFTAPIRSVSEKMGQELCRVKRTDDRELPSRYHFEPQVMDSGAPATGDCTQSLGRKEPIDRDWNVDYYSYKNPHSRVGL